MGIWQKYKGHFEGDICLCGQVYIYLLYVLDIWILYVHLQL
jgi:hypothetical protein